MYPIYTRTSVAAAAAEDGQTELMQVPGPAVDTTWFSVINCLTFWTDKHTDSIRHQDRPEKRDVDETRLEEQQQQKKKGSETDWKYAKNNLESRPESRPQDDWKD